jgi:hypothetical protein
MTNPRSPLDDAAFMRAFLDLLIPPEGGCPGAGELELGPAIASWLEANAVLGAAVRAGLDAVRQAAFDRDPGGLARLSPSDGMAVLESLLPAHPVLLAGIAPSLLTAYYQHPRVLEALGEPPRPPFPEGFDLAPVSPQLIESLQARQHR